MFLPMQAVANARRRIYLLAPLNQEGVGGGGQCYLVCRLLNCSVLRRQPLPQGFLFPFAKKRSGNEVAAQELQRVGTSRSASSSGLRAYARDGKF